MKTYKILFVLLAVAVICGSCVCKKKSNEKSQKGMTLNQPTEEKEEFPVTGQKVQQQAVVYKMRKDYSQYVPVTLSEDKNKVVSYPAVSDVYYNGKLALPTPLAKGYWLDNRGINENTAFTSYTYEQYSKLSVAPSAEELYKKIIDKSPLTKIVYCGVRSAYKNEVEDLNKLIKADFPGMKQVTPMSMEVELK